MNDRVAYSSTLAIVSSRFMAENRTIRKTKVGITPIPGCNSNFFHDIKKKT